MKRAMQLVGILFILLGLMCGCQSNTNNIIVDNDTNISTEDIVIDNLEENIEVVEPVIEEPEEIVYIECEGNVPEDLRKGDFSKYAGGYKITKQSHDSVSNYTLWGFRDFQNLILHEDGSISVYYPDGERIIEKRVPISITEVKEGVYECITRFDGDKDFDKYVLYTTGNFENLYGGNNVYDDPNSEDDFYIECIHVDGGVMDLVYIEDNPDEDEDETLQKFLQGDFSIIDGDYISSLMDPDMPINEAIVLHIDADGVLTGKGFEHSATKPVRVYKTGLGAYCCVIKENPNDLNNPLEYYVVYPYGVLSERYFNSEFYDSYVGTKYIEYFNNEVDWSGQVAFMYHFNKYAYQ